MSIDFEVPAEAKAIRETVRQWVQDECIPAEKELDSKPLDEVLGELRAKARAQGLWCPFIPKEYGGMGLGPLANALVQMELGESILGALSMNTQGPDDASMLTLLAHGTDYQKEKFLKPLLNGDKRICFSMTEKAAGADATGMQTRAVKDGNENYILNGEKWFSSSASVADMALVMAKTDPDAPRHKQYSTFIVELPNPGYRIKRNIKTMAIEGPHDDQHLAAAIPRSRSRISRCRPTICSAARATASTWASIASPMAGCATACTTSPRPSARSTWRLSMSPSARPSACCWPTARRCSSCSPNAPASSTSARLMLLHIAYKAEKGLDLRQENSIAKVYLAHMVHKVIDTAIQLHGALGYSQDTPLAKLVHPGPLAAAGRRPRRGAPMDGRPQRHQGVPRARHHGVGGGRRSDLAAAWCGNPCLPGNVRRAGQRRPCAVPPVADHATARRASFNRGYGSGSAVPRDERRTASGTRGSGASSMDRFTCQTAGIVIALVTITPVEYGTLWNRS